MKNRLWSLNFKALILLCSMGSVSLYAEGNTAPEITSDSPETVESSDTGTIVFTATGGTTEAPPDDRGCPPWVKTGSKTYTWTIQVIDGDTPSSDPGSDVQSESDTLALYLDIGCTVEIVVSLQEEWEDSSETPVTLYWPES